ncbi:MAG TPA: pyridoxal-phosphate dependent enzyme [Vicinamibacterales bacterium]|nr:pyridoxal-phosphate dependent enzyme [Vicinamibacterales bacterium]
MTDLLTDVPVSTPDRLVGRTPLVRLHRFEPRAGVEIWAKLESKNPGGSVKDRAALAIIRAAEGQGQLGSGRVLLDATSGNTGIAYAMIGASRGHRVTLCVPANATPERRRLLDAYGAEVILTDPMEGADGAIRAARALADRHPDTYFYADQYGNDANWRAHFDSTAVEILADTGGRLTHFVAGLGTSGTFVGTGRRLKRDQPAVALVSVEPDSPLHGLEGLKHMATAIVPAIYDPDLADRGLAVPTDEAHALVRRLAREEGLFVGPSSGAALAGALRIAGDVTRGVIVTVFPDGGERYLSQDFWQQTIQVPAALADRIRAHGEASYPDECCGALLGRPGLVEAIEPLDNGAPEARRRRFLVTPGDYLRAERAAAAAGHDLVGFYHSHPDHPAAPSLFDRDHAWPNWSYVIVSVREGRAADMRSWRLRSDRTGFTGETIAEP